MSHELITSAIKRAIQHCWAHDTLTPKEIEDEEPAQEPENTKQQKDEKERKRQATVHELGSSNKKPEGSSSAGAGAGGSTDANSVQFRERVRQQYRSPADAFNAFKEGDGGVLSRKGFKAMLSTLGMNVSDQARKQLRKLLSGGSKVISLRAFERFVGDSAESASASKEDESSVKLAKLPVEVPLIPASFRPRPFAQQQLTEALLDNRSGKRSTALTAPKSRISSQVHCNFVLLKTLITGLNLTCFVDLIRGWAA